MKNKMILGLITIVVITASVGNILAGSFEKYKFKTETTFVHDEERDKMIEEVRDSFSDYAKLKVDMYDIYFSTASVSNFTTDGISLPNGAQAFAHDGKRVIVLNNIQGPSEMVHIGDATRSTLYHELGHGIDFKQDKIDDVELVAQRFGPHNDAVPKNFLYSGTQKFNEIFQKEKYYMQKVDGNNSAYFYNTITEYFAQSVYYYMMHPEKMRSVAPETYMYIRNVFNQKYVIPDKELSYGTIQFDVEFFAKTDNSEYLKDLIKVEHTTINNDPDLKAIVVNKLGEGAADYLKSDGTLSYDDFVKNNTNKTGTTNPQNNSNTGDSEAPKGEEKQNQSVYDADFSSYYGWVEKEGKWYYIDENGKKAVGWYEEGGQKYYFNEDGTMKTGLVETEDGNKVYYDDFGVSQKTGWKQDGSKWYYLDSNGSPQKGWVQDGSKWYYLNETGIMATGWIKDKDTWYYLNSNGSMATGWIQDGSKWYYLNSNGSMAHDTTIDGYNLGSDGGWA